ncbi:hypothetical protein E05_23140 [Plautia stali symbiont]|nr:hypothetical protein E05_23140 [Plautia stali symbiont]
MTSVIFDRVETQIVMDIKILRAFATVAALEHIGQAAERLHISPSPLSRQIQQLESELEMVLFHREKKRLRLTDEGRRFLTEVTPFLQHHERLKDYAQHLQQGDVGRLDIGYVERRLFTRACCPLRWHAWRRGLASMSGCMRYVPHSKLPG